jgi:hypothetical protein
MEKLKENIIYIGILLAISFLLTLYGAHAFHVTDYKEILVAFGIMTTLIATYCALLYVFDITNEK